MNNAIKLIDSILKNMEYVRLLFKRDEGITPLHTFDLVVRQLNQLRVMLDTDYLTADQIREAVRRLEKPIEPDGDVEITVEHTICCSDPLDWITTSSPDNDNPLYRDSVGGEEMGE